MTKTNLGNFLEDFSAGMTIEHGIPRTVSEGDRSLYIALYGERAPLFCSDELARGLGLPVAPLHDLVVFHIIFGKSVPEVSLNAVANLGYADVRFLAPVYPGDTLRAVTTVLGRRETSAGNAGIVWVQTTGLNQRGEPVLRFYRWVMVNKRDPGTPCPTIEPPKLPAEVAAADLAVPAGLDMRRFAALPAHAKGRWYFEDYQVGERIDHGDGITIEEAEHMMATRLYQNTAKIHFNQHEAAGTRFGRRLIYGGVIISLARAIAYNGLENQLSMLAWNSGAHANPTFSGDTIYAWSEVLDKADLAQPGAGALRLRLVAVKNVNPAKEAVSLRVRDEQSGRENYDPRVVLDLDYWTLMPSKG